MASIRKLDKYPAGTVQCRCGKQHTNPTRLIAYDEEAIAQLPTSLSEFTSGRRMALVADRRTFAVAGHGAEHTLGTGGWSVHTVIVPDDCHGSPVCDDLTYEWLREQIPDVDMLLAVGGGVINDLTKWVAFDRRRPYAVLATCASMNGYTAANIAATLKGVKSIVYAQAPVAVLAVPSVIQNAPFELTASGLGDVVAKPITTADWIMNHVLFGEYFCPEIAEMITTIEPSYFNHPEDVRDRKLPAIQALYEALIYSGVAMTVVGTSAPASGGEHMLSHTLDMMASVDGVPHDLHGRQVGLGTVFAAALYERLFEIDHPKPAVIPRGIDRGFWGPIADSIAGQYEQKQPHLKIMREKMADPAAFKSLMDAVRGRVRSPGALKDCLRQAGAAHAIGDIKCSRKRMLAAVLHMHEIRKRCTVVDLAWTMGVLPGAAEELVDQWLVK